MAAKKAPPKKPPAKKGPKKKTPAKVKSPQLTQAQDRKVVEVLAAQTNLPLAEGVSAAQGRASNPYLRYTAMLHYTTSLDGISIRELSLLPMFKQVHVDTLTKWATLDGWTAKRKETLERWRQQIEGRIGTELVRQKIELVRKMTLVRDQLLEMVVDVDHDFAEDPASLVRLETARIQCWEAERELRARQFDRHTLTKEEPGIHRNDPRLLEIEDDIFRLDERHQKLMDVRDKAGIPSSRDKCFICGLNRKTHLDPFVDVTGEKLIDALLKVVKTQEDMATAILAVTDTPGYGQRGAAGKAGNGRPFDGPQPQFSQPEIVAGAKAILAARHAAVRARTEAAIADKPNQRKETPDATKTSD